MKTEHMWIQYAYDDPENAPIVQTAGSEEEAREDDELVMSGCCWYRYDIAPGEKDGNLINPDGPYHFNLTTPCKPQKINVTRIDKSALFAGKNGKYLDLVLFENRDGPDQYGNDGFVTQDIGKERREAGEKGPIIGNWKRVERQQQRPQQPAQQSYDDGSEVPF